MGMGSRSLSLYVCCLCIENYSFVRVESLFFHIAEFGCMSRNFSVLL